MNEGKSCRNCRYFTNHLGRFNHCWFHHPDYLSHEKWDLSPECIDNKFWQRDPKKWLSIPPESDGWYWLKENNNKTQIVEVIVNHYHVYRSGTECFDELNAVRGLWQGPIKPED